MDHSVNVVRLSFGKLGAAFTTGQKLLILYWPKLKDLYVWNTKRTLSLLSLTHTYTYTVCTGSLYLRKTKQTLYKPIMGAAFHPSVTKQPRLCEIDVTWSVTWSLTDILFFFFFSRIFLRVLPRNGVASTISCNLASEELWQKDCLSLRDGDCPGQYSKAIVKHHQELLGLEWRRPE